LAKRPKNGRGTELIPADARKRKTHILINGTQIYRTHAKEYLAHATKWLHSGLYNNAAVAVAVAALCMLVVEGILEAAKTLTTFLAQVKQGKDDIRTNPVFVSAKEALKALITRDEDLLIQAELGILTAPIVAEEDQLLLLRLIEHIRSKISTKSIQK